MNIEKVLMYSDRENISASNELIFNRSKLDFHGPPGQKLVFRALRKCLGSPLLSDQFLKKMSYLESAHLVLSNYMNFE